MIDPRASRLLRELCAWALIGLVVASLAGFAWLTRHPEAPIVATAAGWPVVGAAARSFQGRWLPPPGAVVVAPEGVGGDGRSVTRVWVPVREVTIEDFFDLPPREESPRALPLASAFEPWHGDGPPPLGDDPAPPLPLPGRPADPGRLDEARSFFSAPPLESRLGPYALLTDVDEAAVLAAAAAVAEEAEPLYRSRLGLALRGDAAETVVLYRDEEGYRRLQARSERIRGLSSRGHVGWGIVALYTGGAADTTAVGPVLRHEIAHLLNRRALGPALPPWLDEGVADDLAGFELDASLAPRATPLEAMLEVEGARIERRGMLASLEQLAVALDRGAVPPLLSLLGLDWDAFMSEPAAGIHYAASAWLVRYLLDENAGYPDAFRAFLRQVSRGGGVGATDLEAALGRSWPEIESGWRRFVGERAVAAGVAPPAPVV